VTEVTDLILFKCDHSVIIYFIALRFFEAQDIEFNIIAVQYFHERCDIHLATCQNYGMSSFLEQRGLYIAL